MNLSVIKEKLLELIVNELVTPLFAEFAAKNDVSSL